MRRIARWLVSIAATAVWIAPLGGCSATRATSTPVEAPADFGIDITMMSGDPDAVFRPVHLRNGRLVLAADGQLAAAFSEEVTAATAPKAVRVLSRDEVNAVWALVYAGGLLDPARGEFIGNIESIRAQPGQMTYLIQVTADDHRTTLGRTRQLEESPDPAIRSLVRALAQLALVSDEPDPSLFRLPTRYDFGPDPYARYRSTPSDGS